MCYKLSKPRHKRVFTLHLENIILLIEKDIMNITNSFMVVKFSKIEKSLNTN